MMRTLLAIADLAFWHFVLLTTNPSHEAYMHARWRVYQERERIKQWLDGDR
jgi:hypothetical protein